MEQQWWKIQGVEDMVERRSTASKGKNGQRAERLKRTFQSQEMHVFRMNGLTEEPAGLFKIFKEKKGKETSFLNKRQIICLLRVSTKEGESDCYQNSLIYNSGHIYKVWFCCVGEWGIKSGSWRWVLNYISEGQVKNKIFRCTRA